MLWLLLMFTWQIQADEFIIRTDAGIEMPEAPEASLTKVMWWNIACSSTRFLSDLPAQQRINFSPESSWQNLRALIGSDFEPDILVLGEYCPSDFDHPTYEVLAENYSHIHRVVRSNPHFQKRNGLRVFSKFPIEIKEELLLTDGQFASSYLNELCSGDVNTSDRVWSRKVSILKIQNSSNSFTLAPIHLANPWREIARCNPFYVLKAMYFDEENVNYLQTLDLISSVPTDDSTLLIGDFNAPKRGGILLDSKPYKELEDFYGPSLIRGGTPTFFDKRDRYPEASIDHAFSLVLDTSYGEVLPLSGSDHLPIMVGF